MDTKHPGKALIEAHGLRCVSKRHFTADNGERFTLRVVAVEKGDEQGLRKAVQALKQNGFLSRRDEKGIRVMIGPSAEVIKFVTLDTVDPVSKTVSTQGSNYDTRMASTRSSGRMIISEKEKKSCKFTSNISAADLENATTPQQLHDFLSRLIGRAGEDAPKPTTSLDSRTKTSETNANIKETSNRAVSGAGQKVIGPPSGTQSEVNQSKPSRKTSQTSGTIRRRMKVVKERHEGPKCPVCPGAAAGQGTSMECVTGAEIRARKENQETCSQMEEDSGRGTDGQMNSCGKKEEAKECSRKDNSCPKKENKCPPKEKRCPPKEKKCPRKKGKNAKCGRTTKYAACETQTESEMSDCAAQTDNEEEPKGWCQEQPKYGYCPRTVKSVLKGRDFADRSKYVDCCRKWQEAAYCAEDYREPKVCFSKRNAKGSLCSEEEIYEEEENEQECLAEKHKDGQHPNPEICQQVTATANIDGFANINYQALEGDQENRDRTNQGTGNAKAFNIAFLMRYFPKFCEEHYFASMLLNMKPLTAEKFSGMIEALELQEKLDYFCKTEAQRRIGYEDFVEKNMDPKRHLDYVSFVTDYNIKDWQRLKLPHSENRVVMREGDLIIDTRNTNQHFYIDVYSRGAGDKYIRNGVVIDKNKQRVDIGSKVYRMCNGVLDPKQRPKC